MSVVGLLITVVGSGRVGTSAALQIALKELGDIVLVDIVEGLPQGEALDLNHACAILNLDVEVTGTNDYKDIAGSDVVVVTAGMVRKADMTRLDLLHKNSEIIKSIAQNIKEYAPKAKVLVVTNPLDVMTYVMWKTTGFEHKRVMGFSGLLDMGRYRYLIRKELGVSYKSIRSMIIGEHGDTMVLLPRYTHVGELQLSNLLDGQKINEIIERTRKAGAEIIKLRGWSANHGPGAGVAEMVEALVKDTKEVIPTSAYLNGEYGVKDVYIVVPCVLGKEGVEKIIELDLSQEEREQFLKSVEVVKQAVSQVKL